MTSEQRRIIISDRIDKEINQLDFFSYYENNKYKRRGVYCGPEKYSYEDDVYYSIRCAINKSYRLIVLDIIKTCLNDDYIFGKERFEDSEGSMVPLDFIIEKKSDSTRIGYGLNKNIKINNLKLDLILSQLNINEVVGLQIWESDEMTNEIVSDNEFFEEKKYKLRNAYMREFFKECVDESVYDYFLEQLNRFYSEISKRTAIKVIPVLSPMYKSRFLDRIEKELLNIEYKSLSYKFIKNNPTDDRMKRIRNNIEKWTIYDIDDVEKKYKSGNYKIMLSDHPFAKTFATSEWLFYSIDNNGEFDFTSIVTGYLKSIEQLLYYIMMLDIDNKKYASIKMKFADTVINKVGGVIFEEVPNEYLNKKEYKQIDLNVYEIKKIKNKWYKVERRNGEKIRLDNIWVEFSSDIKEYINDTMGDYWYFVSNQSDALNRKNRALICNTIDYFRDECRNGFFHMHMIDSWDDVSTIRNNALYIYFLVFGNLKKDIQFENKQIEKKYKLTEMVEEFRKAIEFNLNSKSFMGDMNSFPMRGGVTSGVYLKKYLKDSIGLDTILKRGDYTSTDGKISHSWLETSEGMIIDMTGDCFNDRIDELHYDNSVYIGEYDDFHKLFNVYDENVDEAIFFEDKNNQFNYRIIMGMFDTFFAR